MKKALVIGTMILTSTSAFAANIIGTHQADMGSAVCLVNISEGGIDISDIRYTNDSKHEVSDYNKDLALMDINGLMEKASMIGTGEVTEATERMAPGSNGDVRLQQKVTLKIQDNKLVSASIKSKLSNEIFSSTTGCSLK